MAYKIETFSNLTDSDVYPQTPNNLTCYDYIKNVKKWNVNELTPKQKRVLFTMRALLGSQYSDNTKVFPFKDGCVIPNEHLPIFDTTENANTLTVSPPNKSKITIGSTDSTMYPQGVYVNFTDPKVNYEKFKNFLDGAYLKYDSAFLKEKAKLEIEIKRLTQTRDNWKQVLADLVNQTNHYNNMTIALNNPNSECQKNKTYVSNTLIPQWNQAINSINYQSNRYWTLYGYINDGINQKAWLQRVYSDSQRGIWWYRFGGNVTNLN